MTPLRSGGSARAAARPQPGERGRGGQREAARAPRDAARQARGGGFGGGWGEEEGSAAGLPATSRLEEGKGLQRVRTGRASGRETRAWSGGSERGARREGE